MAHIQIWKKNKIIPEFILPIKKHKGQDHNTKKMGQIGQKMQGRRLFKSFNIPLTLGQYIMKIQRTHLTAEAPTF